MFAAIHSCLLLFLSLMLVAISLPHVCNYFSPLCCQLLLYGSAYHLTDIQFHHHLDIMHRGIKIRIHRNQTRIAVSNTQRIAEQQNDGQIVDLVAFFKALQNETINKRIANIELLYGNQAVESNKCLSPYTFFTRYLMTILMLTKYQRPGVIGGMTPAEFRSARKDEKSERLLIYVADHKNRAHKPAYLVLSNVVYRLMNVYLAK